ncbi:MAG: S8 family serine peptidase, partial [Xanthobacteraceae bacterium]|nr:S8 family serine peptidase [Xanthobacteraceae bacterium]
MKLRRKADRNARANHERRSGRQYVGRIVAAAILAFFTAPPFATAQFSSVGRGPSLNIAPRIDINPSVRYSPNITYEDPGGGQPKTKLRRIDRSGPPSDGDDTPRKGARRTTPAAADSTYVSREVLIEVAGNPGEDQVNAIARRFRLTRVQSQNLPAFNATFFRWRIADSRSVDDVVRELNASGAVTSAQRNSIFRLQETPAAQNPLQQYALASLRLPQAHTLSVGADVRVAIIDSAIDVTHPEFASAIESSFDALGNAEGAHAHGTSVAGIIAAHQRLTGTAPSARLIAIRAFGAQKSGAESNSFVILKSLDYAIAHGAQVINMSFAGPQDPAIARGLGVAAGKGI